MKTLNTILIFILSTILLCAQRLRPFEPVEYFGLNPDWVVPVKDTVLAMYNQNPNTDEYNSINVYNPSLNIISTDNFIFHFKFFGGGYTLGSTILECRDIHTGQLIWQKRYGLYEDNIQTVLRLMKINEDGNLVVMGQKKKYPVDSPLNTEKFLDMRIFEETLQVETGEVIHQNLCDYDGPDVYPTSYSPFGNVDESAFFFEKENYRYYEYRTINGQNHIRSFILDKCGVVMSDTFKVPVYDMIDKVNILEISEDTIMILSKKLNRPDSTFSFIFKYYTKDLILLDSFLSTSFPNLQFGQMIVGFSKDKQKLAIKWLRFDNADPLPPRPESTGIFDRKGRLLKSVHFPKSFNVFTFNVMLDWEGNDDKIVLLQEEVRQQNEFSIDNYLMVYKYTEHGGVREKLVEFKSTDSLKIGGPIMIAEVSPNKYILQLFQSEFYIKSNGRPASDSDARALLFTMIDKDRFTKPTNSREVAEADEGLIIYPNPGSDALTLAWQYSFSGEISVHNAQGHFVRQYPVDQHQEYIMDASAWPPGLYLLRIYDSRKQVTNIKKWVKY